MVHRASWSILISTNHNFLTTPDMSQMCIFNWYTVIPTSALLELPNVFMALLWVSIQEKVFDLLICQVLKQIYSLSPVKFCIYFWMCCSEVCFGWWFDWNRVVRANFPDSKSVVYGWLSPGSHSHVDLLAPELSKISRDVWPLLFLYLFLFTFATRSLSQIISSFTRKVEL